MAQAQHTFQGASLSEALIELDKSSKHYDISFVYDELEDFTVTKTIKRGRSLPDAVREVCGFYPVRVSVKGHDILVECIHKDRTKLMGRLVGPDRQPVAYANIILYNPTDSVIMDGGVSNEAGDFVIPCSAERARVRISCVGFKTIEQEMPISNVGTIRMQMENNYLGNVTISGRIPVFRSETDRLQYIVSNDEFARGLNAQELLNRVPMVNMVGGRAMILGKGPAQFMLNGRVTDIGNEAIQQKLWTMRSEDIECIEVISNPSGREMMQMGGGGYINIVMRRDQTLGWRGDISAEARISDDWSERGSGSVTYASKKFDITIDAHGGCTTQATDNLLEYRVSDETNCDSYTRTKKTEKEVAANLMFRYMPIRHLELGGMLSWQKLWPEKTIDGVFSYTGFSSDSESELVPCDNTCSKSLTAYCDWQLDTEGKILSFNYSNYKKDDNEETNVRFTNPLAEKPILWNGYKGYMDFSIQSGKLDLSLPFNIVVVDAGASFTSIRNQGKIQMAPNQDYLHFVYTDNHYAYHEETHAAYLSLFYKWDKYSIKGGLRYENIEVNNLYKDLTSFKKYISSDYWLPSLSFSFKPTDNQQINFSWGTSTIRPNFYDLCRLPVFKTGYESSFGNPELRPSRTSHLELSYHNHQDLYASVYHHHASDVVGWENSLTVLPTQEKIVRSSPANEGRLNQTGLYLRYQYQVTHGLLVTAEGDTYYYDYLATIPSYNHSHSLYGWGKRVALFTDWYLNRQHTLLLNIRYQHWFSDYNGLTEAKGYGGFFFALRYSMLDDCLKFSLVANDPFRQHVTDERIENPSLTGWWGAANLQFIHTRHHDHYIGLTATYSFGGKKVRRIHHDTKDPERQRAEKNSF